VFLGYDLGPSGDDGQYGGATEAAVRNYFLLVQLTESGESDGDGGG
jgi:hypothetical protein